MAGCSPVAVRRGQARLASNAARRGRGRQDGRMSASSGTSDLVVVGAGILGLATARELLRRRPELDVTVLEREDRVGAHQTGHNSGVVHAGIYYAPGSLKARLCVEGARDLYAFCERHDVPFERCGKVIVATTPAEVPGLDALEWRGRQNGVPGLRRLDRRELREIEPHAEGVAALHSPATGIVDFPAVARALAREVTERGGRITLRRTITGVDSRPEQVVLRTADGGIATRHAVFCAGAWSDR